MNDFAADIRKCDENLTFVGSKWWAKPEEVPPDRILTRWYFEDIKRLINISTYGEVYVTLYESPPIEVVIRGTYIIDTKPYLLLIDTRSNIVYRINKTEFVYNTIIEKFSTRTINSESDVLEAFERYLRLFTRYINGYGGILTGKENVSERKWNWIISAKYYNFSLLEHKPVIVKKDGFWELNCSVWFLHSWYDVAVIRYNVKVSNKGSIKILNEKKDVYKNVVFYHR